MPSPSLDTVVLRGLLERWREGDRQAIDELLRKVTHRLEALTRKMLRGFPNVRRWTDTSDVFQGSILRLMRSLRSLQPSSTREFFTLAATHVRRELLDLARRYRATNARFGGGLAVDPEEGQGAGGGGDDTSENLDLWCQFHEGVEKLPELEREVVSLRFYHGWTQSQIAELFQVDERSVRRYWVSACTRLNEQLGGKLPSGCK